MYKYCIMWYNFLVYKKFNFLENFLMTFIQIKFMGLLCLYITKKKPFTPCYEIVVR